MPPIEKSQVLERLRNDARNSSHFVWLLADLKFFETSNHWVFAYTTKGDVTLFTLEPLIPGAPANYDQTHFAEFKTAWEEVMQSLRPKVCAFVAIYSQFATLLKSAGFISTKVGQEPWIDLSDCIPRGNSAKGVRSSRNRAIKSGMTVEEWSAADIAKDPKKQGAIRKIFEGWRNKRLFEMGGYLNASDPLAFIEERRYFVAKSPRGIEGYGIATPIAGRQAYFIEDLVLRENSLSGCSELLTLDILVLLSQGKAKECSLGVVSMTTADGGRNSGLPPTLQFILVSVPNYMRKIYNFDGLETFRKRFKPRYWSDIHLAVKKVHRGDSDTLSWLKVMIAILRAFRPRLHVTRGWIAQVVMKPVRRYAFTLTLMGISLFLFGVINHFGNLPAWALARFGFAAHAPWYEWVHRSIISDYLYFDRSHFCYWGGLFFLTLAWAEKTRKRGFIVPFVLFISLVDDWVNYFVLLKPIEFFQPTMFQNLIRYKDVGSSLILMCLLGLQITRFRVLREPLFATIMFLMVLGFTLVTTQMQRFVMNLNHVLFFTIGFLAGKAHFEYTRYLNRKHAKDKPPIARSVAPPPVLPEKQAA